MTRGLSVYGSEQSRGKKERFTALLHHVDVDLLRVLIRAQAGCGTGGRWPDMAASTSRDLEERLVDLHAA